MSCFSFSFFLFLLLKNSCYLWNNFVHFVLSQLWRAKYGWAKRLLLLVICKEDKRMSWRTRFAFCSFWESGIYLSFQGTFMVESYIRKRKREGTWCWRRCFLEAKCGIGYILLTFWNLDYHYMRGHKIRQVKMNPSVKRVEKVIRWNVMIRYWKFGGEWPNKYRQRTSCFLSNILYWWVEHWVSIAF